MFRWLQNMFGSLKRTKPLAPWGRPPGWLGFKHRGMFFEFQRIRVDGEVRSYILSQPKYGRRDAGSHNTHRLYDRRFQRHYVCAGWPAETFEEAKEWARVWCRYSEHYIRTGEPLT